MSAVGAAVLVGTAAGTASAEPAPSQAGWDGSKYWYKDVTGWWRWTSHYDKYVANSGDSAASPRSAGRSPSGRIPSSEPTFRGQGGYDAADGVYWYLKGDHWYWTSHKNKYERYTAGPDTSGGSSSSGPASSDGSSSSRPSASGTPRRDGTEAAISFAMAHLGDPYVWGGNGPHGWDCSGLVMAAYRSAGISLPRVASDQYRATTPISRGDLRRGDLVFWTSNGSASGIHHDAIYLGDGKYLEAPRPGKPVRISSFDWYDPNMYGRVR
ncbi:NlpC/P60 family protein [Streptomyces sp. WAC07061]|uniref:C40 family peptidase n=1 Tax=Streptomyces sp. WAC07061 TaxID=2487410 RepID=UPI000F79119E|nr:C40 family peptidase [Streptomyces sp. WAC07061]RSS64125.1 NlpC/P60 family protein [Streptomyces sp. WAC07061]